MANVNPCTGFFAVPTFSGINFRMFSGLAPSIRVVVQVGCFESLVVSVFVPLHEDNVSTNSHKHLFPTESYSQVL